ncbi:hypothetical protein KBK19_17895 [Microvirga sp. STR05]|uniref:Uncharacterized protein n=1 Tax=Hymenobacter duratus TaxID=2771356 RepID=A0ABR8JLC3_9BACT|nr:hypothetical protein [Hymenobacter duratus]MBD2716922.1 hypothetical protein [Hymenobacter duratus]MBR7951838.1 hypothetical protein [Microvirga sp. STR05]
MKTSLLLLLGLAAILLLGWLLTHRPPAPHTVIAHGNVPVLHRTTGQALRRVRPGPPTSQHPRL